MNYAPTIYGLIAGVLLAVTALGIIHVARKAWRWVKGVINILLSGVRALEAVAGELAYIRNLSNGVIGEQEVGGDPSEARSGVGPPQAQDRRPGNSIPFPKPILERFEQEPVRDATIEDTDMELLKQTDEDLVEIERLDNLRKFGGGMEVEDPHAIHPGIVAEAK